MTDSLQPYDAAIDAALREHARCVEPRGAGRWEFQLGGEVPLPASAWLEGGWLRLVAVPGRQEPGPLDAPRLRQMLQDNAALQGGAKFGLNGEVAEVLPGAEIPLADDLADLEGRIRRACAGLGQGADAFCGRNLDAAAETLPGPELPGGYDLASLCREAGWRIVERADGQVAVPLEVPEMYLQASIRPRGQDGLRLEVPLEGAPGAAAVCHSAVHVLLLSACRAVRMARATARVRPAEAAEGAEEVQYGWEVVLAGPVAAWELDHALAALSVACRLCAREVKTLHDETIARQYLAVRGWSSLISNGTC